MTKVDIKRLDSVTKNDTTATEQINDNFRALQEAIENTLSRDGTGPNYMDADLDMNSYRIINSANPVEDNDIVNLKYVEERIGGAVESAKTAVNAATQAANSAQSALVSSANAINTLRNAEEQLNNVIQYVDESIQTIDNTINEAVEDVKQQALDAAQESIDTAADQATAIVYEYTNNEIKPQLNEIVSNASESAENASESAGLAAEEAADAEHWANDSRIWAEGEQAEVETLGGELSSRGFADFAMAIANTPEDVPLDQSKLLAMNIVKGPKGDKGDKGEAGKDGVDGKDGKDGLDTFATNCITEIPQDIKLELKDGVLTLKAGSKVYAPNGFEADGVTPKFDKVVVNSDLSRATFAGGAGSKLMFALVGNGKLTALSSADIAICTSGTTTPTAGIFYNTNTNYIYNFSNSNVVDQRAFPIAVVTQDANNVITSIDQVFNGFGYIGSTVFALPGVKGLIPNGRNADGTLKNTEFTSDKVIARTFTQKWSGSYNLYFGGTAFSVSGSDVYDGKLNNNPYGATVGKLTLTLDVISNFSTKLPFRAVDYSDSSWVAAQGMPTTKKIALTLGASGTTYTAPASGYIAVGIDGVANNWITFDQGSGYFQTTFTSPNKDTNWVRGVYAIGKGGNVNVYYGGTSSSYNKYIYFYYAEGEK